MFDIVITPKGSKEPRVESKALFAEDVLRDLTSLVGEMVTHDSNHHTSCFKYVKRTKHGKTNPKAKDCRYHFPKELGVRLRACCLVVTDQ